MINDSTDQSVEISEVAEKINGIGMLLRELSQDDDQPPYIHGIGLILWDIKCELDGIGAALYPDPAITEGAVSEGGQHDQ